MSKVRIYEYAKANNVQSKQLIESLKSMGVEVSNHMSAIDEETLNKAKQAGKPAAAKGQGSTSNQKQNSQNQRSNQGQKQRPQNNQQNQGQKQRPQNNQQSQSQGQTKRPSQASNNQSGAAKSQAGKPNQNRGGNRPGGQGRPGSNNRRPGNNQNRRNHGNRGGKRRPQSKVNHQQMPLPEKITISGSHTVSELAAKLHREASELIKKLIGLGVMATINQELDKDTIELLAADYGVEVKKK